MYLSNILQTALNVIGHRVTFAYYKFLGDAVDEYGTIKPTYADAVTINNGHTQPIRTEMLEKFGLQVGPVYREFFANVDLIPALGDGQQSNDYIIYNNARWDIVRVTRWYDYDKWNRIIAVEHKGYV